MEPCHLINIICLYIIYYIKIKYIETNKIIKKKTFIKKRQFNINKYNLIESNTSTGWCLLTRHSSHCYSFNLKKHTLCLFHFF